MFIMELERGESVALPALFVRIGKVKEPSRFLPFLPNFSSFFPDFSPLFGKFLTVRDDTLPPPPSSPVATPLGGISDSHESLIFLKSINVLSS